MNILTIYFLILPHNAFPSFFNCVIDKSVSVFLSIVTFSTYYSTTYDGNDIIAQSGSSKLYGVLTLLTHIMSPILLFIHLFLFVLLPADDDVDSVGTECEPTSATSDLRLRPRVAFAP